MRSGFKSCALEPLLTGLCIDMMHAVASYLCRGIEAVITGLTRNQFVPKAHEGSNPSLCAKINPSRTQFGLGLFSHIVRARTLARKARRGFAYRRRLANLEEQSFRGICVARSCFLKLVPKRNVFWWIYPEQHTPPSAPKIDKFRQKLVDFYLLLLHSSLFTNTFSIFGGSNK